jgi:5-methyltetrahydrofolate--homocysteine methyltransferase
LSRFSDRLTDPRPLLFDGGFGTQLFARGVELPNSALANQSHGDAVVDVHRAYLAAGSDCIETNTFVASSLHLEMAEASEADSAQLARLASEHARRAADEVDREVYIAGALGPSPGAIEADAGDTEFGIADVKVRDAHERIATALAESGVDFFLVETMFSAREAAIAVDVARQFGLPIGLSLTYKFTENRKTGQVVYRTDWGHGPPDALEILASGTHSDGVDLMPFVQMIGLNCGAESTREDHSGMAYAIEGGRQTLTALADRGYSDLRLIAYPNAGLPKMDRQTQETYYLQGPDDMARDLPNLLETGAWMVGGCCGTSPEHIGAFRTVLDAQAD